MKKRSADCHAVALTPKHEKLPWPGLKASDHLTRVATRAVKEAREDREIESWAQTVTARVLDYVTEEVAVRLIQEEMRRPRKTLLQR